MTDERARPRKTPLDVAQQREQVEGVQRHKQETLHALIAERVIHALGEPGHLLTVSVRPLWQNRYRVNVFVGTDAASARVVNSYFLEVDDEGAITTSTPTILKLY
jgi:hypothetical protein